jgi:prepilin-type N-terminal cleavage/methylation domain-containing protein/prepilin-type processing-associated H-X9-DG protein
MLIPARREKHLDAGRKGGRSPCRRPANGWPGKESAAKENDALDRAPDPLSTAGFTLIELLVVVAIIALLLAVMVPSYAKARKQTRRVLCLSNQRQIGLAMHAYGQDYRGSFPIAQYPDAAHLALVAWDTITYAADPRNAKPGLIWQYAAGGQVQQCPSYKGGSNTSGDPYTGYNYNTTYIGRGRGEVSYRGMGEAPARISEARYASRAALVGDGGWIAGANKFMRAPFDPIGEGTVHAGGQAFRHLDQTNVVHVDGHAASTRKRFRKPGARPSNELILNWPANGFLSADDSAYAHR